jgi:UDP-glucuronate decarboxylase
MKHSESILMKQRPFSYDISEDIQLILDRLDQDINAFNNKTILITGGTGFFGRWLLEVLCTLITTKKFQMKIFVLSRNPKRFLQEHSSFPFAKFITFIEGDVSSFKLPKFKLDYLIHMATTAAHETFSGEDQLSKLELLYSGTKNTLQNATANGVEKVLFTSSGVAYGPSNGVYLSEEMLQAPITTLTSSALGEGKRLAEFLVAYYAEQANYQYSIARCFSFAGQYLPLDLHYAIGNFVLNGLNRRSILVRGTGKDMRSYLYIGDAMVWLLKLLIKPDNEIYNVGSNKTLSIAELADKVRERFDSSLQVEIVGSSLSKDNFKRSLYVPNIKKIQEYLDVSEWTDIDQIIDKMKAIK